MGLDMYLTKKIYIGANYEHRNVEANVDIKVNGNVIKINPKKISEIHERAAYWRKANHIHRWFVENVQDGEDDCGDYEVTITKLKELVALCEQVLEKKDNAFSEANLPTQAGFFFGGTEYGEYYYEDVADTIQMLNEALEGVFENDYEVSFEYQSSW
jgi:hypothetical protein